MSAAEIIPFKEPPSLAGLAAKRLWRVSSKPKSRGAVLWLLYRAYSQQEHAAGMAKAAAFEGNLGGAKFLLKNAAPGIFFALLIDIRSE